MKNIVKRTLKDKEEIMPQGKGTYGSKKGRPPEKSGEYRHGGPVTPSHNAMNRRAVIPGYTGDNDVLEYLGGYNKGGLVKPTKFSRRKGAIFQDGEWSPGVKKLSKKVKKKIKNYFSEGSKQERKQKRSDRKKKRLSNKITKTETKLKSLKQRQTKKAEEAARQKMNYTRDIGTRILSGDKSVNVTDIVKAYKKKKK